MTDAQAKTLATMHTGKPAAWVVVYEDGTSSISRDDARSLQHAAGAHAIRVPLVPALLP